MTSFSNDGRWWIPHSWIAEFREQIRVALEVPRTVPPKLALTYFPQLTSRLDRRDLTRGDIEYELMQGFQIHRKEDSRTDRPTYRLRTERLDVWVHNERRRNSTTQFAVLDNASRLKRPEPRIGAGWVTPTTVSMHEPHVDTHCDLEAILTMVQTQRRLEEAEQALTHVRLTPRRHTQLRDDVRRRYGSLRALLKLVEQRAKFGDKLAVQGTVVDAVGILGPNHQYTDKLALVLDQVADFPQEDGCPFSVTPLQARPDGKPIQLRLVEMAGQVIILEQPQRIRWPAGTRLVVSETDDFRFGRHLVALHEFIDEHVTGNWTSLATLLCQPANLAAPASLSPATGTRLPLNTEQRLAVAGAVGSPHAFFIQGPPGTGKTQVISELVSRLTRRGERVLLTAPTHVAVDEVLRRIGAEPGVLPIRLSWNDDLVAADVRHFTKSRFDGTTISAAHLPGDNHMAAEWRERLGHVLAQYRALQDWDTSHQRSQDAQSTIDSLVRECGHRDQGRRTERTRLAEELAGTRRVTAACAEDINVLRTQYDQQMSGPVSRGPMQSMLTLIGMGHQARVQRRLIATQRHLVRSTADYMLAATAFDQALAAHEHGVVELAGHERADHERLGTARREMNNAFALLSETTRLLSDVGLGNLPLESHNVASRLTELIDEERLLTTKLELQQRWFQLLGADDGSPEGRARALITLRQALVGAVNLVCSTTTGFGGDKQFRDLDYDTLVVDEASKVTSAEFLIPARRAHRWIMVGDEKQLRPYVESAEEHHLHALAALHMSRSRAGGGLDEAVKQLAAIWKEQDDDELHQFREKNVSAIAQRLLTNGTWDQLHRQLYQEQITHAPSTADSPEHWLLEAMHQHLVTSLFERSVVTVDDGLRQRLIEQRRMVPELAELVRQPIYGGDYRTADEHALINAGVRPLVSASFPRPLTFLDTAAHRPVERLPKGSTSFVNDVEADMVADVCWAWERELHSRNERGITVSVLAFYGSQAKEIRRRLGHPRYPDFAKLNFQVVDSVDRIQGQQSDLVIVSFCRTSTAGPRVSKLDARWARWLQNVNRLNVACTRGRRALILVGHQPTLRRLSGVPAAERFFANLFDLAERGQATLMPDFVPSSPRRRK